MTRTRARLVIFLSSVSCLLLLPTLSVNGQSGSGMVEWRSYGNDEISSRFMVSVAGAAAAAVLLLSQRPAAD